MKSSTRAIYISDASGKTAPEAWQPGFKQATFRPRTDQRASKTLAECTAQRSRQCRTGENDLRHSPARHLRHERPEPIFLRGHIAFGCAGSSGLCMHPCGSESGRVDVIVRLIQVKAGTARLSASERETISSLAVPCGLVPGSCDLSTPPADDEGLLRPQDEALRVFGPRCPLDSARARGLIDTARCYHRISSVQMVRR